MRRETLGGWSLIVGAVLSLVTMALHPTGHDIVRAPTTMVLLNMLVHTTALVGQPVALYGAFVLTRRLSGASAFAELALSFFGASVVAAMIAAVASGFLAPGLLIGVERTEGAAKLVNMGMLNLTGGLNQAFARVLVASSSTAILLWSIIALRSNRLRRAAGYIGVVVGIAALLGVLSGHLRLDVHGFGAVVLAQAIWMVLVGWELRGGDRSTA
jgi:hypothetical protein